jgi:hypothetical protein
MQFSEMKSTIPLAYWTIAPGAGQALSAVHAAVLADQPFELAVLRFDLAEAHQGPGVLGQVVRVLIAPDIDPDLVAQVIPLVAGRLARLAADAFRYIDKRQGPS